MLERADGGVGTLVRLHMLMQNELACYAINPDGSDGCPALEKWAMSGEFGPVQKWWVGLTAEGLLYRNRR